MEIMIGINQKTNYTKFQPHSSPRHFLNKTQNSIIIQPPQASKHPDIKSSGQNHERFNLQTKNLELNEIFSSI